MKTLEEVLTSLGVEDEELHHFIVCDVCELWSGYDGMEIDRCRNNPLSVKWQRESEQRHTWWELLKFFHWFNGRLITKPFLMSTFDRILESTYKEQIEYIINEYNRPLWGERENS